MFASKDLMFGQQSGGYQISRSVRLRSSASAYFSRTLSTPTNSLKWTWSGWVKRGAFGSSQSLFGANDFNGGANTSTHLFWMGSSSSEVFTFQWYNGGFVSSVATSAVFRDPSAWYHLVCAYDSTQATASNRVILYVNGIQQTSVTSYSGGAATYPTQNTASFIDTATGHRIGGYSNGYLDGYLTEINFIDGQALTPASFGVTDTVTGVWNPKKYSGTYGTNGFYLNFSDNSGATATTIGKDSSGNGNNWTPNNISVTAGTTYDSMVDSPTNYGTDTGAGGEVRGNYSVLNAVYGSQGTLSNGNLTYASTGDGTGLQARLGTIGVSTGKWYFEVTVTSSTSDSVIGIVNDSFNLLTTNSDGSSNAWINKRGTGGTSFAANGATSNTIFTGDANGDVVQIAFDASASKFWIGRNGTWASSGNPAAGTNAQFTNLTSGSNFYPLVRGAGASTQTSTLNANFGQRAFSYTAPSGFKALCTQNLPTPTVNNGANYMAASLYTGTGASQSINNSVNSISFQPDWVWIKSRSAATDNKLTDSVRGTTKALISNTTGAETTDTNGLTAFGSSGFTVGTDTVYNNSGATYVGWNWKGGGTAVTNTAGSITSSVSANTTAGFSVVTYTGNGTNGSTIGHGLGVTPKMIIVKSRSIADNWPVYHGSMPNTDAIRLNTTGAAVVAGFWNNTTPGSSVFTVGGGTVSETNTTSATYVAYCFAPIAGYSAFGSYTGNGSTDGPFIYCGFRPRFVLWKRSDSTGSWYIQDTSRNPYNQATLSLYPNLSDAETSGDDMDYLSNGFKVRDTFVYINASGGTYIYAAFAENPFTIARAR